MTCVCMLEGFFEERKDEFIDFFRLFKDTSFQATFLLLISIFVMTMNLCLLALAFSSSSVI